MTEMRGADRLFQEQIAGGKAPDIAVLAERLLALHTDVADIKRAISELAKAITQLALVEERLSNTNEAMNRMFAAVSLLEKRVTALETLAPLNNQVTKWVSAAVIALIGGGIGYLFRMHG